MKKTATQVALATAGLALAIHAQLALADGPESAYDPVPVRPMLDPSDYKVNADGAKEDPEHPMSDVARAYRNGFINRGKADDEILKKKLAAQHNADMAEVQQVPNPAPVQAAAAASVPTPAPAPSLGDPSAEPAQAYLPPPPPGYGAPAPYQASGYGYGQPVYAAPPPPAPQVYVADSPSAQYVPVYPDASYVTVAPVIELGYPGYYGGRHHHWR